MISGGRCRLESLVGILSMLQANLSQSSYLNYFHCYSFNATLSSNGYLNVCLVRKGDNNKKTEGVSNVAYDKGEDDDDILANNVVLAELEEIERGKF